MANINSTPGEVFIQGVQILRADRSKCIICGHPTGDCADSDAHTTVVGPGIFPSIPHEETFIVQADIWTERQVTPYTTGKVLVVAKGTAITLSRAAELGLL